MSNSLRVQMIAMLAIGGLIGYAIASRQPELSSKSTAAETSQPPVAVESPAVSEAASSVCLTEPRAKSELLAMADDKEGDVRVAQNPRRSSSGKKPNILFIMGDDIGWMQPSCYHRGLMVGETPNIDRIAKEGGMFMHYYAESSCTAGRCAFITGMHPYRAGMVLPQLPGAISYLRPGTPCLAQFLYEPRLLAPASSARTTSAIIRIRCRPRTGSRSSGATSTTSTRCSRSASRISTAARPSRPSCRR